MTMWGMVPTGQIGMPLREGLFLTLTYCTLYLLIVFQMDNWRHVSCFTIHSGDFGVTKVCIERWLGSCMSKIEQNTSDN